MKDQRIKTSLIQTFKMAEKNAIFLDWLSGYLIQIKQHHKLNCIAYILSNLSLIQYQ